MSANLSATLPFQNTTFCEQATAQEVRKKYLHHEACVKSIGTLYFIGSLLLLLAGIVGSMADKVDTVSARVIGGALLISLSAFLFWVADAIRKLKPWTRIAIGIVSGIGLLGFPLGTMINGYILYLVFCKKGEIVFSPQYRQVIEATPQIKYGVSVIVWICLAFLAALLAFLLICALLSG
jgi:hypothetical protein